MNAFKTDPPEGENVDSREESLTDIKHWAKRLRADRPIVVIILLILGILIEPGYWLLVDDFEYYLRGFFYLWDTFTAAAVLYCIWIALNVPRKFQELLISNEEFFESEEISKKFKRFARDTFRSKIEFYIPLIIAIFTMSSWIYSASIYYIFNARWNEYWFNLTFNLVRIILYYLIFIIAILLAASAILIVGLAFKCLNHLGTEEFPLKVSYKELRMGDFYDLGKFIISITIPAILFSIIMSMIGLFYILYFKVYDQGYIIMFSAIIIDLILIVILYRSTINIHKAIIKFKSKLKKFLLDEINKYSTPTSGEIDYQKICNIHDYYDKIDKVSDWPFNPTSFKQLVITFISTVVPLLLSLFGFG